MVEKNETAHNVDENEKTHDGKEVDYNDSGDGTENENVFIDQKTEQLEDGNTCVEMTYERKKALLEFRCRVEDAILGIYLLGKPGKYLSAKKRRKAREKLRDIALWGVPLLPSKGHADTDLVLLKFLRATEFNVQDAFEMLRKTLIWRRDYKTDGILEEKLGFDLENVMHQKGRDRDGHPLFYIIYAAFKDKELYKKAFGTEEKCKEFLRWWVQYMEKGIKKLGFSNGGVDSAVQIIDLNNSLGPGMKELRSINKETIMLVQDYYPEIIHKVIVINVPFWYYASHMLLSRFIYQRNRRKFIFVRPSKVTKTLLNPEDLPVDYGGLKRENDDEFSPAEKASELIIRRGSTTYIEFPATEAGVTVVWDITIVGWEVSYKEEFIPDDEGSYRILVQNQKKMGESVRNSFYITEPGRILLTIENQNFKKKRVFYRAKTKPGGPMYIFLQ
ncbi:Patellin-4 [Morella rubra]|uniref:Patellin-4 n=1 Tax=Morella rubra TaxID=262757 RepID=A0A6A1UKZ7_9ROSI|nr:Patellin-4 [Morella rubra]